MTLLQVMIILCQGYINALQCNKCTSIKGGTINLLINKSRRSVRIKKALECPEC